MCFPADSKRGKPCAHSTRQSACAAVCGLRTGLLADANPHIFFWIRGLTADFWSTKICGRVACSLMSILFSDNH